MGEREGERVGEREGGREGGSGNATQWLGRLP